MKKLIVLGMLVVVMCSLTGCGENNAIDRAANQVIEVHEDAEDAIGAHNEQVLELEDSANQIEEELE